MKKWRHTESFSRQIGPPLARLIKSELPFVTWRKSSFAQGAMLKAISALLPLTIPSISNPLLLLLLSSRGFRIQSLILGRLSTRSAHILQGYGINSAPFVPCPCHSNASDTTTPSQHTLKAWALHLAGEKRKDRQEKHLSPGFASLTSIRASAIFDHVFGVDIEVE